MQQNSIKEIRKQILNRYNLKIGDRIKYELLHAIYQEYETLFDEKTFAQEILEISYESYCQIKYDSNKKAILLKDEKVDIEAIREEILQRFSLKPGDKINYQKLCEIAKQYNQITDERTIAYEVLDISKKMLYPIKKNPNYSTTILSNRFKQSIDDLREKILNNEGIKPGDFINYVGLHKIAIKYKISDRDLAIKVFEIKGFNYDNIKNHSNRRTKILTSLTKEKKDSTQCEIEDLINTIIKNESLIPGCKINYEQLHEIYIKYSLIIDETTFAVNILGINKTRFFNIKSNRKDKAVILKDMLGKTIEQVRNQLIEKENIKPGYLIDYEGLTRLIEIWRENIEETILVRNVLGLSSKTVRAMKNNPSRKATVMKGFIEEKTEEDIINLRNKIFESEEIKAGNPISYADFTILYEKYKNEIDERTFALRVLQIPQDKYLLIKRNAKKKTKICKELVAELNQDEIEKIKQIVYEKYGIDEGKKINYEILSAIAAKYKDKIKEREFAYRILGISEKSYYGMKYDSKKQAYVLNPTTKEKADKIRYKIVREKRFYTLKEIQDICKVNELTIDEFCSYVVQREMHKKVYLERNFYSELLNKKGKIFIGRGEKITKEFARKNQKLIIDFAKSLAVELCRTYQATQYIEDYAQDTMVYILEKCGDLEKNFEDDFDLCKGLIYTRAKAFIKGRIILGKKAKTISLDSYYKDRKDNSLSVIDREADVESKAIDEVKSIEDKEVLLKQVLEYIEIGENPIEAIRYIAHKNNLDFQDLIEEFRNYYIKTQEINLEKEERD
jgi:hypothetical protein